MKFTRIEIHRCQYADETHNYRDAGGGSSQPISAKIDRGWAGIVAMVVMMPETHASGMGASRLGYSSGLDCADFGVDDES